MQLSSPDGRAFPTLKPDVRARLAARGVDPEKSFARFLDELRVQGPPPRLLLALRGRQARIRRAA